MGATKHPIDLYVGARLKRRRGLLGLSQTELAKGLGITFQQIQKYENGSNRVGASRLYEIAHLLGVQVDYFYDGAPDLDLPIKQRNKGEKIDRLEKFIKSPMGVDVCRAFASIEDPEVQQRLSKLVKAVSESKSGLT